MDARIRDFSARDYPAVAAVWNAAAPKDPVSVEGVSISCVSSSPSSRERFLSEFVPGS
jgi:hypothetical protein